MGPHLPAVASPAPAAPGAPAPAADEAACTALAASGEARGERSPAPGDNGACAIADGFTLRAIKLADGKEVSLGGGVLVRCAFAASVAQWVREDVAPRLAQDGAALQALSGVGGLECRTRNHQPGAKISEHARGAALDLRVLTTSAGAKDLTKADAATKALRLDMKRTACARFTTVLGPGSDSFHTDHIHMDMAERRNGYRMCQWEIEGDGT